MAKSARKRKAGKQSSPGWRMDPNSFSVSWVSAASNVPPSRLISCHVRCSAPRTFSEAIIIPTHSIQSLQAP